MRWTLTFCRAAGECDAAIVLLLYRARCAVLLKGIGCTCLRIALPFCWRLSQLGCCLSSECGFQELGSLGTGKLGAIADISGVTGDGPRDR